MTRQTFRIRNADGTVTTVYNMHADESVSLPPEVILAGGAGGGSLHYGHPAGFIPAPMNTAASAYYGHEPPVVILEPTRKQEHHLESTPSTKKRNKKVFNCAKKCNTRNSPWCITIGVILSLLVITGYVSLILLLIPGSTKNRWNEQDALSPSTFVAKEGDVGDGETKQQPSEQKLRGSPKMTRSSLSDVNGGEVEVPRGRTYNAVVTILDPVDKIEHSRVSRKSDDAGE